jgi:hypothetical protein
MTGDEDQTLAESRSLCEIKILRFLMLRSALRPAGPQSASHGAGHSMNSYHQPGGSRLNVAIALSKDCFVLSLVLGHGWQQSLKFIEMI